MDQKLSSKLLFISSPNSDGFYRMLYFTRYSLAVVCLVTTSLTRSQAVARIADTCTAKNCRGHVT